MVEYYNSQILETYDFDEPRYVGVVASCEDFFVIIVLNKDFVL